MTLALINYLPVASGLGDEAPVWAAKDNACISLVNAHDAEITALAIDVATLTGEVATFSTELTGVNTSIGTLTSNVSTINGEVTTLNTTVTLHTTEIAANAAAIAGITSANLLYLSSYPGIDKTGVTACQALIQTLFNACAAAGIKIMWDCPIYCQMGINWLNTIFVPSNLSVEFIGTGRCITDGIGIPTFSLVNATDVTMKNFQLQYTATFGVTAIASTGAWATAMANTNTVTKTNYLQTLYNTTGGVKGNNYSGATALWQGNNSCAVVQILGACNRIKFSGRMYVPDGAPASSFIPFAFNVGPEYNAGTTVTGSTPVTAATCSVPINVEFTDFTLDGSLMGWAGQPASIKFTNVRSVRYSDLQDASGTNVGGVANWFPPPHLFYMDSPIWAVVQTFADIQDDGIYVGSAIRRSTSSGTINSLKMELGSGSSVDGYICMRPDGWLQGISRGHQNCRIDNVFAQCDTTTAMNVAGPILTLGTIVGGSGYTTGTYTNVALTGGSGSGAIATIVVAGGVVTTVTATTPGVNYQLKDVLSAVVLGGSGFTCKPATINSVANATTALNFPGPNPFINVFLRAKIIDTALVPAGFPVSGLGVGAHQVIELDLSVDVADWPNGAYTSPSGNTMTYNNNYPGFTLGGSGLNVVARINFLACTNTSQTFRGCLSSQTPGAGITNSFVDFQITGWRPIASNLDGLKQRLVVSGLGVFTSNRVRILDVSNNWEAVIDRGRVDEFWSQCATLTPTAGSSFSTGIALPTNFAILSYGWSTGATALGPTGISLGWSGSTAALAASVPVAINTNSPIPWAAPLTVPASSAILLTATAGTFSGVGGTATVFFAVRAARSLISG